MHSINENGQICVNLDDYGHLSDSIRNRKKIDQLIYQLNCPKEITHFSISIMFRNGQRYYISNLYLWSIPYRTEGLCRGDVDHARSLYHGKEFFIQRDVQYDELQTAIVKILESRYNMHTTFAMIRQCYECDFIIETYHENKVDNPEDLYYQVRDQFEQFIWQFIDSMKSEIQAVIPELKWSSILTTSDEIKKTIMRRSSSQSSVQLTVREKQCLDLIAKGLSNKLIADKLHISPETVATHAKSIRYKLDCKSISAAVYKATSWGIIS
ncbi:response regulator transcription factor [Legionella sp. CNM-4043-24]|uniref:response regulator transcription factor n=1 Tax=Legionella sp. CNM-4043-24 TaxID=3421646 RepID=UPI00403AF28F